jgi:hypothetical protein
MNEIGTKTSFVIQVAAQGGLVGIPVVLTPLPIDHIIKAARAQKKKH